MIVIAVNLQNWKPNPTQNFIVVAPGKGPSEGGAKRWRFRNGDLSSLEQTSGWENTCQRQYTTDYYTYLEPNLLAWAETSPIETWSSMGGREGGGRREGRRGCVCHIKCSIKFYEIGLLFLIFIIPIIPAFPAKFWNVGLPRGGESLTSPIGLAPQPPTDEGRTFYGMGKSDFYPLHWKKEKSTNERERRQMWNAYHSDLGLQKSKIL